METIDWETLIADRCISGGVEYGQLMVLEMIRQNTFTLPQIQAAQRGVDSVAKA
jgi:hypothetical protein